MPISNWRKSRLFSLFAFVQFMACSSVIASYAAEKLPDKGPTALSVRWENDFYANTDENYTSGAAIALTYPGKGIIGGVWDIFGAGGGKRFASYDLGQLLFTPSDTSRTVPDPADRPYAGFLYLGTTSFLDRADSLHSLKLTFGVVGPLSQSESAQNATHRAFLYNVANGWDHQLKNEPIINLNYEYRHKYSLWQQGNTIGAEIIPIGGVALGNFLTEAQASVQLRIGYNLPDDYGSSLLRGIGFLPFVPVNGSTGPWGVYAYASGGANFVVRNITLDGNTFNRSPSVDKRIFLPSAEFGASLWSSLFQASFSYVMMGKEFYGQKSAEEYGSVLFSVFF